SIFLYFAQKKRTPIIAITGSKGKSSTASSIYYGLQKSGFTAFLGGNITVSPLTFLEKIDGTTPVVLELSSWQLRDLRGRNVLKPKIAIITKIVPDHQNWYHSMDRYIDDKRLIYENQTEEDFTIVDADADNYREESENPVRGCQCWGDFFAGDTKGKVLRYSQFASKHEFYGAFLKKERDGSISGYSYVPENLRSRHAQMRNIDEEKILGNLLVPGSIMRINLLKSALALQLLGIAPMQIADVLGSWEGLAHRLEAFHTWKSPSDNRKIVFYNDSCATVPEAAAAATQAFKQDVILITGGTDKELNFLPLAQTLSGENGSKYHAKDIFLLEGTGTDKLTFLLDARHIVYFGPYKSFDELLKALHEKLASPASRSVYGSVNSKSPLPVVFSPGCTSFGMFLNEFDRGDQFKKKVKQLFF
ncbi:MAG: UDP-N-acetylmuramoyl-L-alanine--D-glutamate ligase, partial [Treponema sp.]|nr:UDP-N-acetylmuramoyl-L-alanine--D-glutamate ligase [Treponema sp.]